jgi:heavy metal translocating P-type ATPase
MGESASARASRHPVESCLHCDLPVPASRQGGGGAAFCCFGCRIASELARPALDGTSRTLGGTLLLRLGMGIFLAMNIMAFGWLSYAQEIFGEAGTPHGSLASLFSYLLMFLCTVVIVLLGLPIVSDALGNLTASGSGRGWRGRMDVNLLISVGVFSAYVLSVVHTLRGAGSLYYDTAAMVLVLVTLGNYLEAEARRRAAQSGEALLAPVASLVRVERGGSVAEMDADDVRPGDRVLVRPGETVPVDGAVLGGSSLVDESTLTGESRPRAVGPGDLLLAGSLNLDGPLRLRVERAGADRVVAQMRDLLRRARERQPPIQRLADRIAAFFVPAVVAVAAAVFVWRTAEGDATAGLLSALSVLLISCPCALGLAAPLAAWNALRRASSRGILVDSAVTLERAAAVTRLFFDKTGTLTRAEPRLDRIDTAPGTAEREALALAAALESASLHGIARAFVRAAAARELAVPQPAGPATLPGLGVEATVGGRRYRLGNARMLERFGPAADEPIARPGDDSGFTLFLCDDERVLARFELAETLRDRARESLEELRDLGIEVAVLTGDRSGPAARLAAALGVPFEAGLLPQEKLDRLEAARARGAGRIGMVGDGVNDAPVLAAADVGVALGSAADLARRAGNVSLIGSGLDRVPLLFRIARHAHRRIRVNLGWAFAYNVVGIPLAAAGLLSPVFSAAAMIASSLTIVALSRGAGRVEDRDPAGEASNAAANRLSDRPPVAVAGS